MPRVSRIQFISRRVARLKETVQVDTQKIREKLLNNLQMIFDNAVVLARGDVTVDGEELTLNERRDWTRVAAYTAQIIQSIAKGFDERQKAGQRIIFQAAQGCSTLKLLIRFHTGLG